MARILNIEKSGYTNQVIEAYTSVKLSQYNKYLDKTPLFVTWFHINEERTRSDVGSGGIHSDLGPKSPIRYNQINNLPVYNIPELKPDVQHDEDGFDVELDISDAFLLPNTIKATPGDYLIISIPNSQEYLFSVNDFDMNTIQSNDYYVFSANLRRVGDHLIDSIKPQVVEEYETIFENIGTEEKCFVRVKDIDRINDIGKLFLEMRKMYYENYFDQNTGCFVCKNNDVSKDHSWFYDAYVEKFIMNTQLFYDSFDTETILLASTMLTGVASPELNTKYRETLYYAIENDDMSYLASYPYYYLVEITRRLSPFTINHINCNGVNLEIMNHELVAGHSDGLDSGMLHEYFSHNLIQLLKGEAPPVMEPESDEEKPDTDVTTDGTGDDLEEREIIDDDISDTNEPVGDPEKTETSGEDMPEESPTAELSFLENIVYEFMLNHKPVVNRKDLAKYSLRVDPEMYQMIPIILFILKKYYDSFFKKVEI